MFDLSEGKRIRREDLLSPHSSGASSPAEGISASYVSNALRDAFSSLETFNVENVSSAGDRAAGEEPVDDAEEEQEFEFRLFCAPQLPAVSANGKQGPKQSDDADGDAKPDIDSDKRMSRGDTTIRKVKIRIRSPTPPRLDAVEEGGFVARFRRWDYYFTDPGLAIRITPREVEPEGPSSGAARQGNIDRFFHAAVTGEEVLAGAKDIWPGCQLPWRVIHVQHRHTAKSSPTVTSRTLSLNTPSALATPATSTTSSKSRKRPGKKRRIILRKRLSVVRAAQDADRDKRTRRNREKKVKRRQKNREKQAAIREAASGGGNEEGECIGNGRWV